MLTLALRIILHQPLRYAIALTGIAVAAGLAFIQLGLYIGFKENASIIVDHTEGDIWVCDRFQDNFDFPKLLSPRVVDQVRSIRGVASANPLLIVFCRWKRESGAEKTVQIVGFDPTRGVGRPWQMLSGSTDELAEPGAITVDTTSQHKLDDADIGRDTEINAVQAHVVGITDGIRSFQGNPMVFTSLDNARSFEHLPPDSMHYIVVRLEEGADRGEVLNNLKEIENCDAFTKAEFSYMAQDYWLRNTGAGYVMGVAALMGLIVGVVVAGQVLYSSTLEHIREYGTLKAMGASNGQVASAIVAQALAGAIPAHLLAGGLLLIAQKLMIGGVGIHLSIDLHTYVVLGFFTVGVCISASLLSVVSVMRLEPAEVFKG